MASHASSPLSGPSAGKGSPSPGRTNWASNSSATGLNGTPAKQYMHLKDIVAAAQPDLDPESPINLQLEKAKTYITTAKRSVEFRRPDLAYKDYIRGADIVVNYIPRHKDYNFYCNTRKGWEQEYRALFKQVHTMEAMMEEIRRMIEEDNIKTGIEPKSQSQPSSMVNGNSEDERVVGGFDMPSVPAGAPRTSIQNVYAAPNGQERVKPRPGPKPESLHSPRQSMDALSQRFAQLRTPSSRLGSSSVSMPTPEDYMSQQSLPSRQNTAVRASMNGTSRPSGPRDMPALHAPSLPPKIPLLTSIGSLPRAPSPTYSPVSTSATSNIIPPKGSIDSSRPSMDKRPTYYNQPNPPGVSQQLQRAKDDNPYRPRTPNGVHSSLMPKSSSSEIPHDPSISVERLVEFTKRYNVLLIDVRAREQFDSGHIYHNSIICMEPLTLKEGISAEDLEERLVLSPESEQDLFQKRDEYDIVVYYDQSTSSINYLKGRPTGALRALYDTLVEFNHYKPLRDGRPPALLIGGIDAWVDMMGQSSLKESSTAVLMGSIKSRKVSRLSGRPLARQRMASANSSLEVRKRRLREHKPLDLEEERAWSQKAQAEEVQTEDYIQNGSDGESVEVDANDEELPSPFIPDYEAFLRKFPDLQSMPQSMMVPSRPTQQPPAQFDRMHVTPSVPSRPPPAVPRPSYSGLSDKQQPQAPLARQTSATRPALYSSQSSRRLKLPRTGRVNFGVTCYMNSTIQCLSATTTLSQFFLEDMYKHYIQKNWKGSSGIMPGLYTNLIRSLWKSDVEVIKPTTFRTFCGRMNREWAIDRQQDAKEFYDFLVDCLHEDLNVNWNRTQLKPLSPAEELQRERTPISVASGYEWQRFQHRDYSFVSSLFAGQHASRLRCTSCHNTSTTYEAFYSISVEIPQQPGQGADIYSCLRSYTQEEMLSGDEVWKCPHCKCEREATKQIILTRLPQFLVVHFKRFSASKNESARKIHTPIEFPLHNLTMDPFMIQHPPSAPAVKPVTSEDPASAESATTPPYTYSCYGVLRHLGNTLTSGHYISLVKDQGRGCWRKFDDDRTIDFDPARLQGKDRLQSGEAYIVFFQRAPAH